MTQHWSHYCRKKGCVITDEPNCPYCNKSYPKDLMTYIGDQN